MKKYSLLVIILFSLSIIGCKKNVKVEPSTVNNSTSPAVKSESVEMAPNFTLTSTNGKNIQLSDFRGKVVIVDFWATWCPPCRKGIPDLIDIQKEFKNEVVVIGISLDQDTKSEVIPFMKKFGINYPVVYGDNKVVNDYGSINAIPTSFVINKDGKIVDKHIGLVPKSEIVQKIKEILS
jgi:thiol-disulfide isomerase/thioredoxin